MTCYCWAKWIRIYYKHTRKSTSSQFKIFFSKQVRKSRIRWNQWTSPEANFANLASTSFRHLHGLSAGCGWFISRKIFDNNLGVRECSEMFLATGLCEAGWWSPKPCIYRAQNLLGPRPICPISCLRVQDSVQLLQEQLHDSMIFYDKTRAYPHVYVCMCTYIYKYKLGTAPTL